MYRCHQCGHYYVPGYLECACRTTKRQVHIHYPSSASSMAKEQVAAIGQPNTTGPSRVAAAASNPFSQPTGSSYGDGAFPKHNQL
jgi:hypothetical protein